MLIRHSNTGTPQEASWKLKSLRVIDKHQGEKMDAIIITLELFLAQIQMRLGKTGRKK